MRPKSKEIKSSLLASFFRISIIVLSFIPFVFLYLFITYEIKITTYKIQSLVMKVLKPSPKPTPTKTFIPVKKELHAPEMKIQNNRYVHNVLHFSLPAFYAKELQNEDNFGHLREIKFLDKAITITAGYFYDKKGKLMNAEGVAQANLGKNDDVKPQKLIYQGRVAFKVEIKKQGIYETYSLIEISNGPVIYEIRAKSTIALDNFLKDFIFIGNQYPTEDELVGDLIQQAQKHDVRMFFPVDAMTINTNLPTITGKFRDSTDLFLDTKFELNSPSYNQDSLEYSLTYKPGRLKNVQFFLDNKQIADVFGFAQYPKINCQVTHKNYEGYVSANHLDLLLYGGSRNVEPLKTLENCLKRKGNELPPTIFFFKPERALADGNHLITVKFTNGKIHKFSFKTDTTRILSDDLPTQEIPKNIELDDVDNCTRGYYYDSSYLQLPLPKLENSNLRFGVSFPQSDTEKGSIQRRQTSLKFENKLYDMYFPQSSTFFFDDEFDRFNDQSKPGGVVFQTNPYRALYVPLNFLYYSNNVKATIWGLKGYNSSEYLELFPIDVAGRFYRQSIPRSTTSFSGCDG